MSFSDQRSFHFFPRPAEQASRHTKLPALAEMPSFLFMATSFTNSNNHTAAIWRSCSLSFQGKVQFPQSFAWKGFVQVTFWLCLELPCPLGFSCLEFWLFKGRSMGDRAKTCHNPLPLWKSCICKFRGFITILLNRPSQHERQWKDQSLVSGEGWASHLLLSKGAAANALLRSRQ